MKRLARALCLLPLGLSLGCLSAPRMDPPEPEALAVTAPVPRGGPSAVVAPLAFAAKEVKGCLVVGALKCKDTATSVYTAFLVRTGSHTFLVDAGVGADLDQWLDLMPGWQARAVGMELKTSLGPELARFQVAQEDVEAIVLTHAHFDHAGGLTDLRVAQVYAPKAELDHVAATEGDYGDGTMPAMFDRAGVTTHAFTFDGPAVGPFASSHDLFGDGSVILLPLPGHTPGSTGILLPDVGGRPVLFVGDMVWDRRGLEIPSLRPRLAANRLDWDKHALAQSMYRVKAMMDADPRLLVVPSHDLLAWKELEELSPEWVIPTEGAGQ